MARKDIQIPQDPIIPKFLRRDVREKLAYVDEAIAAAQVSACGSVITLALRTSIDSDHEALIKKNVEVLVRSMCEGAFESELKVIEDHTSTPQYDTDPMPELLARREVVESGPGYFIFGPLISRLVTYVESRLLDVADEMHASPYRVPALIPPAYLQRVQYLKHFPHSLTFVTHLRSDLQKIQSFSEEVSSKGIVGMSANGRLYAPMPAMLAPTICHHIYFALSDTVVPPEGLIVTASGNCFRYESINMVSLERVWNFSMREIIFIGTEEQVNSRLNEVRGRIREILGDLLISHRVMTANDPFFIGTYRNAAAYQNAFELKLEVCADLPYKRDTIAAGSYNRHEDFFGRTLNIRLADGKPAHSGCVGLGFERLALAFIAQHGLDTNRWPSALREGLKGKESRQHKAALEAAEHC
jgi:seryl-tRNA synthetase